MLASRLRLPPLVGYLLAGIAIGPFTPGFVADIGLAGQLAEIGVILLMFGIGLHFSIKDLLAVYAIAVPGALAQIAVSMAACAAWPSSGAGAWSPACCSASLSRSRARSCCCAFWRSAARSTRSTAASRSAGSSSRTSRWCWRSCCCRRSPDRPRSSVPVCRTRSRGRRGVRLALTVAKVAAFVALVLVVGTRLVPWLLEQVARTGSRELFTLSVLATALGIAYGSAELFGVSFALGAFFAGVVLSESDLSHQAAADSLPLRDAFAVLFFVSVGMLFDPMILVQEPLRILAVLVVIIVAKSLPAIAIVLAFRHPLGTALSVSAGLAQIGEFSFILAGLGVELGLLPPEGRDLILAGALLSITLNPLVFDGGGPVRGVAAGAARAAGAAGAAGRPARGRHARCRAREWRGHAVIVGHGRVGGPIGGRSPSRACRSSSSSATAGAPRSSARRAAGGLGRCRGARRAGGGAHRACPPAGDRRPSLPGAAHPRARPRVNPRIDTVVRAHREGEFAYLERQGVGLAVMGERELALGMMDYALRSLGLSQDKARLVVQGFRTSFQVPDPKDSR